MNLIFTKQRRKFLFGLIAGFSVVGIGRWGSKKFESQLLVDYGILDSQIKSEINSQFLRNGLRSILAKGLDTDWINNYELVRNRYLSEGLLLHTSKEIHADSNLIIYKNSWKSKSDFRQFCREVKINQLLREFESESLNLKLLTG